MQGDEAAQRVAREARMATTGAVLGVMGVDGGRALNTSATASTC